MNIFCDIEQFLKVFFPGLLNVKVVVTQLNRAIGCIRPHVISLYDFQRVLRASKAALVLYLVPGLTQRK